MFNCKLMRGKLLSAVWIAAFLVGCVGTKVTQENYEKVQTDMTLEQVKSILGEPTKVQSMGIGALSGAHAEWKDNEITIGIQFLNGKVKMKEWFGK